MQIIVNGESTTCNDDACTVSVLLDRHRIDVDTRGVAVAVNDEVVPRGQWARRPLRDGDRVEIIHAVQGG